MPDRISLTVQIGEASFTAEGPADVVLWMYQDWLTVLNGCDYHTPDAADAPELPAFREQPIGRA